MIHAAINMEIAVAERTLFIIFVELGLHIGHTVVLTSCFLGEEIMMHCNDCIASIALKKERVQNPSH